MSATMVAKDRRQQLLQMLPAMLLALLYASISFNKLVIVADELGRLSGNDRLRHTLLALHATSSAIFFGLIAVIMFTRKQPIRREKRLIGWVLPTVVTVAMAGVGWFEPRGDSTAVLLLATFFVIAGTGFTIYALRHLGRHFGVVSDVRGLVTTGPYRWMRHPLYGGETLTSIGLVLAVANPVAIAAFTLGTALQITRARVEEQSLTAALPEYREYASQTPMLIPLTKIRFRPTEATA
ncbi:MAG TPA: isoprenylcysteine carboxylmethyltransferase family protein [Thermomicrobiales bacterium]|nr:isoprenylcysteine carboxylmethyltransferase family protein [Thermomicrobiales bacterium]